MTILKDKRFIGIIVTQVFVFILLVFLGVTGSSINQVRSYGDGLILIDNKPIVGHDRAIRSDEWAVTTQLAISQYKNDNDYPIVNERLGSHGKHLSVVHDVGTPVKEIAALARPATWGFFFLDLNRALAWYWWLPVFICFNGCLYLLEIIFRRQLLVNAIVAATTTFSYHSVVWSFWPAYQIGLATLSTALFIHLLRTDSRELSIFLSVTLGLSLSSLALTLYVPRIIPLVTLFIFIVLAIVYSEKLYLKIPQKFVYLLLSVFIVSSLLLIWYIDNKGAIESILDSTYPGARRVYGGSFTLWDEVRGWLSPVTMFNSYGYLNSCEAVSYCSFLFPLFILIYAIREKFDLLLTAIILFLSFGYSYLYVGLPHWLGDITLWSRTTPGRSVIAIEVAQMILIAWVYKNLSLQKINRYLRLIIAFVIPIGVLFIIFTKAPSGIEENLVLSKRFYFVLFSILLLHLLLAYKFKIFPLALLLITLCSTAFWHPISFAPSQVSSPKLEAIIKKDLPNNGKIVVATGGFVLQNVLAAAGLPVLNPTSHYIDDTMYDTFYRSVDYGQYRKFNHLMIEIVDSNQAGIESIGDYIRFKVDGAKFNFSLFPADYLLAPLSTKDTLDKNGEIFYVQTIRNFIIYQIKH